MPEITKEEYKSACEAKSKAEKVVNQYIRQSIERFQERLESGVPFTDAELIYAAIDRCSCGHGLAYPKECGPGHYWDCSAILKGIHDQTVKHTDKLPFAFWSVLSEEQTGRTGGATTRPKPNWGELKGKEYRHDFSETLDQDEVFFNTVEMLKVIGYEFVSSQLEHDCITGEVRLIGR